ncbi:MAG: hypothetical protein PUP92_28890 [Rhizonema sp. PD38]|nr:hypothetical protein [Rhizonema sp. PD38]
MKTHTGRFLRSLTVCVAVNPALVTKTRAFNNADADSVNTITEMSEEDWDLDLTQLAAVSSYLPDIPHPYCHNRFCRISYTCVVASACHEQLGEDTVRLAESCGWESCLYSYNYRNVNRYTIALS